VPILRNAHPIRDFAISPDGRWIAYMQTSDQEDLFLARTDGTEYRRLTDDAFRDRAPSFSPDGQHITFASDRGGRFGIWWIRPDGSGLEHLASCGAFGLWSPDGSRIACTNFGSGWGLVDMTSKELPRPVRMMPSIDASSRFWPLTWSADGKKIAGPRVRNDGTSNEVMTFTVATEKYDKIFGDPEDSSFKLAFWLSDNRRLLLRSRKGISLLDTATGRSELLLAVRGQWVGGSASISRDDRWISYSETGSEGDIWLAELK
jgi:dipeptidyl aminopeptidase/acylaminoacyl peptidase